MRWRKSTKTMTARTVEGKNNEEEEDERFERRYRRTKVGR